MCLFYVNTQCDSPSKNFPPRLYKSTFMTKVKLFSEIGKKHVNATEHHVDFLNLNHVKRKESNCASKFNQSHLFDRSLPKFQLPTIFQARIGR